ncbi:MAG: hypothetical protein OEY69_00110, partial [Candidatus Krumholzibacteria bacterium]|nr:hypothetical protein [Candidatus Krumholzibacteria bacterium]
MRYAAQTEVSAERSKAEIERLLQKYGATSFTSGWQGDRAAIMFELQQRRIRFVLTMPAKTDKTIVYTASRGLRRSETDRDRAWEQAVRQRWRALLLVVKAKLEAVEAGISTFEEEFMSWIVL